MNPRRTHPKYILTTEKRKQIFETMILYFRQMNGIINVIYILGNGAQLVKLVRRLLQEVHARYNFIFFVELLKMERI